MRAYVLCGGFGTRLRSVTDTQKALVPVHGEPFLARVLRQLARAGISEAVLCAHYRAEQVAEQLAALAHDAGLRLTLVVEATAMGTGGALLNALREQPAPGRYLVLNADTFLDAEGYRLMVQGQGNALLGVQVDDRSRYGSLEVDAAGRLLALREKGREGPGLINAGVYAFTCETFASATVRACSMEQELLPELLAREAVGVIEYGGRFIDIGTPQSLDRYANDFRMEP
ncbi:sugar phosphate nucleotidyltransferase [Ectopseudomonas guguanensis]|uniref:D-glycero-alpha-D-manno-heptose 1-phosphate guanylyltransferase n=1 Tax=Ectopseudomonas guguanensis TaxID=1198456 RepID=A0A1H0X9X8_9GAMM|nr:sugar phosphate nucleotidyltransferase [Pseudomonas guguanensis]SDP99754.1 D-glycero-alpha-D-manno-heptose 1-phosphate guanylyltransferase [Pseudomonas guguanensis]